MLGFNVCACRLSYLIRWERAVYAECVKNLEFMLLIGNYFMQMPIKPVKVQNLFHLCRNCSSVWIRAISVYVYQLVCFFHFCLVVVVANILFLWMINACKAQFDFEVPWGDYLSLLFVICVNTPTSISKPLYGCLDYGFSIRWPDRTIWTFDWKGVRCKSE